MSFVNTAFARLTRRRPCDGKTGRWDTQRAYAACLRAEVVAAVQSVSFLCAVAVCRTVPAFFLRSRSLRVKQKAPGSARRPADPGLSLRRRQRPIVWRPCRCGGDREMFAAACQACVCPLLERALIASRWCHFSPGAHPRFDRRVSTYVPLSSRLFCVATRVRCCPPLSLPPSPLLESCPGRRFESRPAARPSCLSAAFS